MVRRKRGSPSGLALLLQLPWWVSAVLAVAGYASLRWLFPAMVAGNIHLEMVARGFQPLAPLLFWVFAVIAGGLLLKERLRAPRRARLTLVEPGEWVSTRPTHNSDAALAPDFVGQAYEALRSQEAQPKPKPTAWSLTLLQDIEWKRFEAVAASFYEEIGLRAETLRCGPDGGIDAKLYEKGLPDPSAIVQCKAWSSRSVGIKPVRELLGVMTHEGVPRGVLLATGDFTAEATKFAKGHPIDLVTGQAFLDLIGQLSAAAQARLLAVATEGDYMTPTCPSCGVKTVWRDSDRGGFWGCRNYPRCRSKFFKKVE